MQQSSPAAAHSLWGLFRSCTHSAERADPVQSHSPITGQIKQSANQSQCQHMEVTHTIEAGGVATTVRPASVSNMRTSRAASRAAGLPESDWVSSAANFSNCHHHSDDTLSVVTRNLMREWHSPFGQALDWHTDERKRWRQLAQSPSPQRASPPRRC